MVGGEELGGAERGDLIVEMPRTPEQLATLEARYTPFAPFRSWSGLRVDQPRWTRFTTILGRRSRAADQDLRDEIADRLLRAAALESAALDGLLAANPELTSRVLSIAISSPEALAVVNDSVHLVSECNHRALVLAQDAAQAGRAVDEPLIAVLQDVITESQATYTVSNEAGELLEVDLPRRQYKPVTNYLHFPDGRMAVLAPAARVPKEMERLVAELGSPAFQRAHPILQAAYAHHALSVIHPFADGNGRLARVVASIYLLREAGVPLLVFADQWPAYYQAIWAGRQDNPQLLVNAIAAFAMATVDLASNLLSPRPAAVLAAAGERLALNPAQPGSAVDEAARALLEVLWIELREALVSPPPGLHIAVAETRTIPTGHVEAAYRVVADPASGRTGVRIAVSCGDRFPASRNLEFLALASSRDDDLLPVALREITTSELFEVALGDAYPIALEGTVLRVRAWIERLVSEWLSTMLEAAPSGTG